MTQSLGQLHSMAVQHAATHSSRGLWCNLCGARLAGNHALLQLGRKLQRSTGQPSLAALVPTESIPWSICVQCYHERLRCATCGVAVGEQAFMLEGDSRLYCRHCFESRPRCDTCDRPVGERYSSNADGRTLCERCSATAVTDPAVAYALYGKVRAALAHQLGMTLRHTCHLKLVSRHQILSVVEETSLHSLDADSRGRCFGLFLSEGRQRTIYIENGLPRIVL